MKIFVLLVIVILALAGFGVYQYLACGQNNDQLRLDIEAKLRGMFGASDAEIRQSIIRMASVYGIDPAGLTIDIQRYTRTGAGPVDQYLAGTFPGQVTRTLEARLQYRRDVLFLQPSFELKASAIRIVTPHPQQGQVEDALKSLVSPVK